jgi:hypothetical protein
MPISPYGFGRGVPSEAVQVPRANAQVPTNVGSVIRFAPRLSALNVPMPLSVFQRRCFRIRSTALEHYSKIGSIAITTVIAQTAP